MNKVITYSLLNRSYSSDNYYVNIDILSSEVLDYMKKHFNKEVKEFLCFIKNKNIENVRYEEEYLIDFLILSVLYNVYIKKAMNVKANQVKLIRKNIENINKQKLNKKIGRFFKGKLSTIYLMTDVNYEVEPSINSINKLIIYLELTDEFKEEVKRIQNVYLFLESKYSKNENKQIEIFLTKLMNLYNYFEDISKHKIGIYTRNVEKFLDVKHKDYRYREDVIYTGRKEIEYHLNMVVASIMSMLFHDEFSNCKNKVLLVPSCMRLYDNHKCKAIKLDMGYYCKECSTKCKVRELTKIGEKSNFKVNIVSHQSEFNKINSKTFENVGAIGVACVLNLISGGLKLRELGSKPQCILLDYCGCRAHWHEYGLTTNININKLFTVLEI